MSGYYPPNQHIPPHYYNVNPNAVPNPNMANIPPLMAPDGSVSHPVTESPIYGIPGAFVQYSDPHMQQAYTGQFEDVPGGMDLAQGQNARAGGRRRPAPGGEVKHRRTRSGCYTCRQRRVKCDENHPICERCRKGNRECVYPEPHSATKSGRTGTKSGQKPNDEGSSPEDQEDDDHRERLPVIHDDEEDDTETDSAPPRRRDGVRESSDTPSLTFDRSPSPSTEASSTATPHLTTRPPLPRKSSDQPSKSAALPGKSTPGLPQDIKYYLNYFKDHMSIHHYSMKRDDGELFKKSILEMAIKYEPLRYAVVGYAAYFHTLKRPDGHISHFLKYYNESVSRLRASITRSKKQGLSTFITILQLAAIEEALGDWVNLMGHQKAAYEILTKLYTPETITRTDFLRKVLLWYIRFDLFVGFQSGGDSVLGREWYVAIETYCARAAREDPNNLVLKYEERFAHSRLVAKDSSSLFGGKLKGQLSDEAFMAELPRLAERVHDLEKHIDAALLDPESYVTDFTGTPDPDDIVNPYEPNVIWGGDRWTTNYLFLDMWGIIFMYHVSISMAMRKPFDPELVQKAYRTAQVFEAVVKYPKSPPGAIIEAQATVAIAILFLPKDPKTVQWARRNFAEVEASGYIYSNTLRHRLLESWGLEPSDTWLPNDEGVPPIIRSIKDFIRERATEPRDQVSEDLREMRGIFSSLTISDSPPEDSPNSTSIEKILGGPVPANPEGTFMYAGDPAEFDWDYEGQLSGQETYRSGPGHFGQ